MFVQYVATSLGIFKIEANHDGIVELSLVSSSNDDKPNYHTNLAKQQLLQYLKGERVDFSVPLVLQTTEFQKKVYDYLITIPYGSVCSYKDVAVAIGHEKAYRAVGNANNKNKLPIFIPCHRIVQANHSLGGYAYGVDMKQKLLDLEQKGIVIEKK